MTSLEALKIARDSRGMLAARPVGMKSALCYYDPKATRMFRMRDAQGEHDLWFNNRFFDEWETVPIGATK